MTFTEKQKIFKKYDKNVPNADCNRSKKMVIFTYIFAL